MLRFARVLWLTIVVSASATPALHADPILAPAQAFVPLRGADSGRLLTQSPPAPRPPSGSCKKRIVTGVAVGAAIGAIIGASAGGEHRGAEAVAGAAIFAGAGAFFGYRSCRH